MMLILISLGMRVLETLEDVHGGESNRRSLGHRPWRIRHSRSNRGGELDRATIIFAIRVRLIFRLADIFGGSLLRAVHHQSILAWQSSRSNCN